MTVPSVNTLRGQTLWAPLGSLSSSEFPGMGSISNFHLASLAGVKLPAGSALELLSPSFTEGGRLIRNQITRLIFQLWSKPHSLNYFREVQLYTNTCFAIGNHSYQITKAAP